MSCPSNTQCAKSLNVVQDSERSSADTGAFQSGKTLYGYINNTYTSQGKTPKFNSQRDYIRWKRMTAQLNSVVHN